MRIDIITCLPRLLDSFFAHSILQRAQQGGQVEVAVHDLRDYTADKHRRIDDYPFGGGAGMVMQIEPIANCIRSLQAERTYDDVIYMTPDGERLAQPLVNRLSLAQNLIILCGHYKGVDERVREHF
ncbi:MAG TPA: tRNA (guanosine(37)-N1)-methyltransferase TrmD, partial [Fibrella sp.]